MTSPRTRSAGFFGLHYDFHCRHTDRRVGGRTTPAMVRAVLKTVQPDYVQIDCKGHPGVSSYQTRVGCAARGIVRDQLAVWRRVTRAAGVPLVMHYSGVWDDAAVAAHPSWARIETDGTRHARATSVFGPYVDRLMIPQLIELGREHGVDAAWIDGDCWAHGLDWSTHARAAWRAKTGLRTVPRKAGEPRWQEFLDFCREGFRAYLRHWLDAVHAACPGIELTSNWAFSSHMPEPVSAPVDFLSGDFAPHQSPRSARLQARCLMHQGLPWDLMAWGFGSHHDGLSADKSALQLCQEAALVLSLGGGFQIYAKQMRDGYVPPERLSCLAEVARFCRARQDLCHRAEAVPQVAVLFSHEDWRRRCPGVFPGHWDGLHQLEGVLGLCLDARRHVEVLGDHHARERLDRYPVAVLPECRHLAPRLRRHLHTWVRAGGRLLVVGPHALAALRLPLPIRPAKPMQDGLRQLRDPTGAAGAEFAAQRGAWQAWRASRGARVLTAMHASTDAAGDNTPGAVACRVGRGMVVAVACELGRTYLDQGSAVTRELVAGWLRHLDPQPLVEVEGPGRIEVACMRKDGELRIHLTNYDGPHEARNILAWDHLPPTGPLRLRLRIAGRPRLTWAPEGRSLRARRTRDGLLVEVPSFQVHGVVQVRGA